MDIKYKQKFQCSVYLSYPGSWGIPVNLKMSRSYITWIKGQKSSNNRFKLKGWFSLVNKHKQNFQIQSIFHLPITSRNSAWDINGTRLFGSFHWKFYNKQNSWKGTPVFQVETSQWNICVPFADFSSLLPSMAFALV